MRTSLDFNLITSKELEEFMGKILARSDISVLGQVPRGNINVLWQVGGSVSYRKYIRLKKTDSF
ncbi:MAG: hypothetical protein Hyperionvirus2_133 [Hyperionvirus sp.]|uniref:Uncharacterized protein n=1 Tax=Hyperionvirus sp. TaxID=2487770 RepID=A0A3G5A689_9VIRU|nr:MAG: hypothetical protein Hyperionvirus2_133 [Hyperionvirus sp.]